jgi:intracellular septation protein A
VQFKLWGLTGLMLAFIAAQIAVLYKYVDEPEARK